MTKQIKYKSLIWLDLTNPTKEEIASLPDNFKVHPLIKEELRHPSPRPKIDLYDEAIHLVLHFPNENSTNKNDSPNQTNHQEVDFVLGQKRNSPKSWKRARVGVGVKAKTCMLVIFSIILYANFMNRWNPVSTS